MDERAGQQRAFVLDHARCRASDRAGRRAGLRLRPDRAAFAGILAWSAILAVMLYPLHLRLATRLGPRWSAPHRAGRRRGGVGADGHRSDVAREFHILGCLEPAEPRFDFAAAATMARRNTTGWQKTDGDLDAGRYQLAGGLAEYGQLLSGPAAWLASFAVA